MTAIKDIWQGIWQLGGFESGQLLYIALDILLGAAAFYFVLQFLNTQRGVRYLMIVLGLLVGLVASSLFALSGVHLLIQGVIIAFVVALPVLFQEEWQRLLGQGQSGYPPQPALATPAVVLLSVLFSLLLTGISTGVTTHRGEFPETIKLSAVNVPSGLSASFGSVQSVKIVVTAPRETWKSLTTDSFSATVDLGNQKEGTYNLTIQVTSRVSGVTVDRVKPSQVVVTVEPVIRKTVPVVVKFSGKAGDELIPGEPTIKPEKVEITGPKSVVGDITQVVAPIKLNGETQVLEQKVALVAQTPDGETITTITTNPAEAAITVPLVKAGKLKTVGIQVVLTGQVATGYWVKSVSTTPSVVSVTGPADLLDKLTMISTSPFSVAGLSADKEQPLTLALPSGISIADSTQKVTVKIALDKISTTKTISPEMSFEGLASSLKVTSSTPTSLSTLISGAADLLANLKDGEVKVAIDLSAYKSAGNYVITIKNSDFTLPTGVSMVSFLPSAISVTLENK